jgi:hypothetical protein
MLKVNMMISCGDRAGMNRRYNVTQCNCNIVTLHSQCLTFHIILVYTNESTFSSLLSHFKSLFLYLSHIHKDPKSNNLQRDINFRICVVV